MILAVITFSGSAYGQCEAEKREVDRWNAYLKKKVTEWAREKHRLVKQEFLDCLRMPEEKPKNKLNTSNKPPTNVKTKTFKPSKKRYSFSSRNKNNHIKVSDYANFKGKKKLAWNQYFQESGKCASSNQDMQVFVACAKIRKQNLKAFNARWDHVTQKLKPLLDSN